MGLKGYKHTESARKRISLAMRGNKRAVALRGTTKTPEHRLKISEALKGAKHPKWKGGITSLNDQVRNSMEYRLWRNAVFFRDGYKCIWCKNGGYLQADHIQEFATHPELRFAIDNGRTLCKPCHKKRHHG